MNDKQKAYVMFALGTLSLLLSFVAAWLESLITPSIFGFLVFMLALILFIVGLLSIFAGVAALLNKYGIFK